MTVIAVTGGIGAGKSTVCRRLGQLGAQVIDADQLARDVVAPGTPGLAEVVRAFGPDVLNADGSLNRPALAAVVFSDPDRRAVLNGIIHPRVQAESERLVAAAGPGATVVYDIPLLVETGGRSRFDIVVVVTAPREMRIARLVSERGMTRAEAERRIDAQATDAERAAVADVLIDSSGSIADTWIEVDALWRRIQEGSLPTRSVR
ncbi:MAG TPA: dephospho-CoA kinase [Pseudoclavibacter sp.]|nr:dephospho-CoA kinase [Pseudoclavibacter sp.]